MYKEDIKVLDCTVRDGGLMNKWQFSDDFVRSVYNACVEAGIDYMEIGYLSSEKAFDRSVYGPWKFCRILEWMERRKVIHTILMKGVAAYAEGT